MKPVTYTNTRILQMFLVYSPVERMYLTYATNPTAYGKFLGTLPEGAKPAKPVELIEKVTVIKSGNINIPNRAKYEITCDGLTVESDYESFEFGEWNGSGIVLGRSELCRRLGAVSIQEFDPGAVDLDWDGRV